MGGSNSGTPGSRVLNTYARYRLTSDEEDLILKYRNQKDLLEKECVASGIDIRSVKHYWYKSKLFSIFAKPKEKSIDDLKNKIISDFKNHAPTYRTIKRNKSKDAYLLVIDPADIHIGKLGTPYETGESYNNSIAVKRVLKGIDGILSNVSGFNIDKIVLILGNDILHTDNPKRTTTSGTPQDTDGQWYDNFLLAKDLYVRIIEMLLPVADIHLIHNVSNHDYMTGWMLSEVIKTHFRSSKNMTFDMDMRHRKAFVYHQNLIGTTHNDGAKESDLPLLMAQEFKKEWAATKHRYIYLHHKHHKTAKDILGVSLETSRSVSGADGWHHRNGYQHAPQAMEAYLHHPQNGQIARFTQIVSE